MSQQVTPVIPSQDAGMSVPEPGLRRQVMTYTDNLMLVRHRMEKGWVGARHSHPHEQMVFILSGKIQFESPAGTFLVGSGDSFIVLGNIEHQASALEDSEVLDIFTPYREDYAPKA
ncbi:cupin domain-containing protein [Granulicella sp. 5B5]|uniref:cupin domain-containing protein n=1 Tax=Granulicella sp. 5B5 TaxID=1617967 RepID=UPI0015F5DFDE|nr:cupin domain-containing protein [Granulicella sp. 5B5]QMV19398.1 cupin domain-containing protein [Granulicella sp. 5B5]